MAKEMVFTKEPAITAESRKKEYEVDNSNTAAIFAMREQAQAADSIAPPKDTAPVPAPDPENKRDKKKKSVNTAVKTNAGTANNDNVGALAEMERREREAAENARREGNARVGVYFMG